MPVLPGPGQQTGTRDQQIAEWAAYLDAQAPGHGYGASFTAYAQAHPRTGTVLQLVEGWYLTAAGRGLAASVGQALGQEGKVTQAAGAGAAAGLDNVARTLTVPGFLGFLTSRTLIVRIVKVIVGGALVIIGLAELTGAGACAVPVIGAAAKVLPV